MYTIIRELLELLVKFGDSFSVWFHSFRISIRENWKLTSVIIIFLFMVFIMYKIKKWKDQKPVD